MTEFTNILVNESHSLISLITMIFPSPDWFLGISNMDMCNKMTGEWRESYTRDLLPYDSGTDDGTSFESPDSVTSPRKNIFLIGKDDDTNFKGDSKIKRLGVLTIERVEKNEGNGGDDDDDVVNSASTFSGRSAVVAVITFLIMFVMHI
jgi:hypothetical protein